MLGRRQDGDALEPQLFGQPAEIASVFTKIASGVTLINSLLSTVCAVVLYLALRPALEKAHLLPKD